MTPHNVVAFTVRFHGGPLDGLTSQWAEIYDGEDFRPRPSVVYATEHANEVIEVSRRRLYGGHRYDVGVPGRELLLDCHHTA